MVKVREKKDNDQVSLFLLTPFSFNGGFSKSLCARVAVSARPTLVLFVSLFPSAFA